ncbi:hypothetical protein [Parvularcula sp. IMCC14364]|uniref:hypothetical protein n=1 Tax=Parvularcula sp. IMCC14364 TaxID=3067902 RepID=UPI002741AC03|nr:hypothetical protein [Parvularcula sp. IMCC14364]
MLKRILITGLALMIAACSSSPSGGADRGNASYRNNCFAGGASFCLTAPSQVVKRDPIGDSTLYLIQMESARYYIFEGRAANVPYEHKEELRPLRSSGADARFSQFYERQTYQAFIQRADITPYPEIHIWTADSAGREEDISLILTSIRLF